MSRQSIEFRPAPVQVILAHVGGDTRQVPVLNATDWVSVRVRRPSLLVKWNIAGYYTLNLYENKLVKAPLWSAQDIREAWRIWLDMMTEDVNLSQRERRAKYYEVPEPYRPDAWRVAMRGE